MHSSRAHIFSKFILCAMLQSLSSYRYHVLQRQEICLPSMSLNINHIKIIQVENTLQWKTH